MPPAKPARCCYRKPNGRPCGNIAVGNPPLCPGHQPDEEEVEDLDYAQMNPQELIDAALQHPKVKGPLGKISKILDSFAHLVDKVPMRPQAPPHMRPPQGGPPRPPARPQGPDPYEVLGLPCTATLDQVKARKKALAGIYHPDKPGGNIEAMQRVNAAVEMIAKGKR